MLEQIGAHVEQYYSRARSIVCVETVRLQPLRADLAPDGFPRRLVYELRPDDGDAPATPPKLSDDELVARFLAEFDAEELPEEERQT